MKSSRSDVANFLDEMHKILLSEEFDIDTNVVFIRKTKDSDDEEYSTEYTMMDLEYDVEDVINELKELTIEDYSETLLDKGDVEPPVLLVFCKNINSGEVYIKIKIRKLKSQVLCLSFHYAKYSMNRPFLK